LFFKFPDYCIDDDAMPFVGKNIKKDGHPSFISDTFQQNVRLVCEALRARSAGQNGMDYLVMEYLLELTNANDDLSFRFSCRRS
jgi:hypothetical protein